jgi:outer membrane protein TolC
VRRSLIGAIALAAVAWSSPAQAEEALTLDRAIQEAEATSDRLRLQSVSVKSAASAPLADPRAGSPSIRVGVRDLEGNGSNYTSSPRSPEFVARARIPLPRPWDLATATGQGQATVKREEAQLGAIRRDLRLEVTEYFHTLPLMEEAVSIAIRLTKVSTDHLALVTARRAEGLSTELEWLESEEERRDADEDRASLHSALLRSSSVFATILGRSSQAELSLVRADFEARAVLPIASEEDVMSGLPERSEAIAQADADIERATQRLLRVKLRGLPWLDWFQGGVVFKPGERPSFEVGGAIDVPFTLWGPARSREAELEVEAATIRREAVQRRVEAGAQDKLRDAVAARERWLVERAHQQSLESHAAPILDLADPLLKLQLQARLVRAELRLKLALITLIQRLDQLDSLSND